MRGLLGEGIGTAFLLIGVIGSGIMAQQLTDDVALQLLANTFATSAVLLIIIWMFAGISGAHFNPAVTLAELALRQRSITETITYIVAQIVGGAAGTICANLMFDLPAVEWSTQVRSGSHLWLGEAVATYGLVLVIFMLARRNARHLVAPAVAAYIGGAYWFTMSTSFANPAVTLARSMSDTFAGIAPESISMFIVMQLVGATLAVATVRVFDPVNR